MYEYWTTIYASMISVQLEALSESSSASFKQVQAPWHCCVPHIASSLQLKAHLRLIIICWAMLNVEPVMNK